MSSHLEFSCDVCGAKKDVEPNVGGRVPYDGVTAPDGWFRVRGWSGTYRERAKVICSEACVVALVQRSVSSVSDAIRKLDGEVLTAIAKGPDAPSDHEVEIQLRVSWIIRPPAEPRTAL